MISFHFPLWLLPPPDKGSAAIRTLHRHAGFAVLLWIVIIYCPGLGC